VQKKTRKKGEETSDLEVMKHVAMNFFMNLNVNIFFLVPKFEPSVSGIKKNRRCF